MSKKYTKSEYPPVVRVGTAFHCHDCKKLLAELVSVPEGGPLQLSNLKLHVPTHLLDEAGCFHCTECGSVLIDTTVPDATGPEKIFDPREHFH